MTLPASGPISFNAINVELGVAGTTTANINQASYRTLAGVPSGTISLSNFYGKTNQFAFTISSNQTNANLRTLAVNAGWNQSSKVVATINSGVYVSSNGTGTPALTVNGSFPNGVDLVNSGFIVGMGGNGGAGAAGAPFRNGSAGASGGLALSVSVGVTITNNGTIGGGGGGGGGGRGAFVDVGTPKAPNYVYSGGGGGGGGRSSNAANSSGGSGAPGSNGAPGAAGGSGTVSAAGSGGQGGILISGQYAGSGGNGGGWGTSGSSGTQNASYPSGPGPYSGGGGGGAVAGNSNITWVAFGTRLGGIS
jgi:hypothetical protein